MEIDCVGIILSKSKITKDKFKYKNYQHTQHQSLNIVSRINFTNQKTAC